LFLDDVAIIQDNNHLSNLIYVFGNSIYGIRRPMK
jgi:hypothetical protein